MADIRKVRYLPIDSAPYDGWINFDRVVYAEDHGYDVEERCRVALLVIDCDECKDQEMFRVDAACLERAN